jgi:hypothetical protein
MENSAILANTVPMISVSHDFFNGDELGGRWGGEGPVVDGEGEVDGGIGDRGRGEQGCGRGKAIPDTSSENVVWQFMTTRFLYRGIVQVCQWARGFYETMQLIALAGFGLYGGEMEA